MCSCFSSFWLFKALSLPLKGPHIFTKHPGDALWASLGAPAVLVLTIWGSHVECRAPSAGQALDGRRNMSQPEHSP